MTRVEEARAALLAVIAQLHAEGFTGRIEVDFGQGIAHAWGKVPPVRHQPLRIIERTDLSA